MRKFSLLFLACLLPFLSFAQLTTSALEGLVAGQNGAAIPGATVVITHVPTDPLASYIAKDDYLAGQRGNYTERNASRTP